MAENPQNQSPETLREETKMAINTLSLAMGNDSKITAEDVQSSRNKLSGLGMDPEVVWVMLAKESANGHVLAEISGLPRNRIRKTLELLTEQGLVIPAEGPHKPPRLNVDISSGFGKMIEDIDRRAKKLKDEGRIRKIVRAVPKTVDELLSEYPLYNSLVKRFQEGVKDLKSQKNILVGLSALRSNMEEEMDMAIKSVKEEGRQSLEVLKNDLVKKMEEKQREVTQAIRESLTKSPSDQNEDWKTEISNLNQENLEELSFELHGLLSRLQNTPQDQVRGVLTPIEEYRIIKILETQAKIAEVEAKLANPSPKVKLPTSQPIASALNVEPTEPAPQLTSELPTEEEKKASPNAQHPPRDIEEEAEVVEEVEPETPELSEPELVHKRSPSRHPEDMTDLLDFMDKLREIVSTPTASPATPPPLPRQKREDFENEEEFEKADLEWLSKKNEPKGPSEVEPPENKNVLAKMSRRKLLGILGVGSLVLTPLAGYVASGMEGFSSDATLDLSKLTMPEWTRETFIPPDQNFSSNLRAKEELEKIKAGGKLMKEVDPITKNYLDESLRAEIINESLVRRKIGKLQKEVIAKKSVLDRFEAAWKVLEEAGIVFQGSTSNFRSNILQFEICERQPEGLLCAPMTSGYHNLGQAIDIGQMGMKKTDVEGNMIADVLTEFGFQWGFQGTRKMGYKDRAMNFFSSGKNAALEYATGRVTGEEAIKRAKENADREDLVHFQMRRSQLEKAQTIEEATRKAKEILSKGKK